MRSVRGFTLIELLVVMSIIALLLTIGLSFYGNAQRATRDAKRRGDLDAIRKALEIYKAEKGTYTPATIFPCQAGWQGAFDSATLGVEGTQTSSVGSCYSSFGNGLSGYFVNSSIPEDPYCSTTDNSCSNSWSDYAYWAYAPAGNKGFILMARLENTPTTPCSDAPSPWNYCVYSQN